jgi:hypothetical protein
LTQAQAEEVARTAKHRAQRRSRRRR